MTYQQFRDPYLFRATNGRPIYPIQQGAPNITGNSNDCNSIRFWTDYLVPIPTPPIYDALTTQLPGTAMNFDIRYIVSNVEGIEGFIDPELSDPWDVLVIDDTIWVSSYNTGLLTGYSYSGDILLQSNVLGTDEFLARPTGITYNYSLASFVITDGPIREPSVIIVVTQDGYICGYNPVVRKFNTVLLANNRDEGAVYTGCEMIRLTRQPQEPVDIAVVSSNISRNRRNEVGSLSLLFVTDFFNRRIDVYDGRMNRLNNMPFVDEYSSDPIPDDYAPYNIVAIEQYLYVIYARQNPDDRQFVVGGAGTGYISIFTFDGIFHERFYSKGVLNAPYDISLVPSSYGYPAGSLMVSNFGDGTINIFNNNGIYIDSLSNGNMNTINFGGIRGIHTDPICSRLTYFTTSTNYLDNSFVGTLFPNV